MDKKLNLKKVVDENFFNLPKNRAKSFIFAAKFSMSVVKISPETPEIFICNKTSNYDEFFVSNSITSPHVFLKDEIVQKLYTKSTSKEDKTAIFKNIKTMLSAGVSIVIFPEKHRTIFGEFAKIPAEVTSFIKSFETKITFLTLIGTYFIKPIWSENENKCITKLEQRFSLKTDVIKRLDETEFNERFNGFMPSSASTYCKKYPLFLQGKKFAENLESVIYACPTCKKLFTLYSEISCVKCSECGSAFELSNTGEISLTRSFSSLDTAKSFQFEILSKYDLSNKIIIGYKNIISHGDLSLSKAKQSLITFIIYKDHIKIKQNEAEEIISYKDIEDVELKEDNVLIITLNSGKMHILQGKHKENFYIIFDLINLGKNKKAV